MKERRALVIKRIKILDKLCKRFGKKCWYCSTPFTNYKEVEIDHIVPRSKGGTDDIENLAVACRMCNQAKYYFDLDEFLDWLYRDKKPVGYIIWRSQFPEEQFRDYGEDIEKGLRKPVKSKYKYDNRRRSR